MNRFSLRRISLIAALTGATLVNAVAHAGTITVYTSLEEDEIKDYVAQAKKDLPDVTIKRAALVHWRSRPAHFGRIQKSAT